MKKKLLVAIMCILGCLNLVNAQNEVVIDGTVGGYDTYMTSYAPVYCGYGNSISQQYYTAEEIGGQAGTISSIAFKTFMAYDDVRNLNVYMVNTDKDSFSELKMEQLQADDLMFWGDVTLSTNWVTIDLDTDFEYTGGNLLVCVVDMTGVVASYDTFFDTFLCTAEETDPYRCLWNKDASVPFDPTASEIAAYEYVNSVPCLKLTFGKGNNEEENVSNEVVIDGTVGNYSAHMTQKSPVYCGYANSISQQYYTAEEIGVTNGTIKSIAFKTITAYDDVRNLNVFLVNTDKSSFSDLTMEQLQADDLMFWGDVTFTNNWVTINLDTYFEYTGGNLLICVNDITGVPANSDTYFDAFLYSDENGPHRCLWHRDGAIPFDPMESAIEAYEYSMVVPNVKLIFTDGTEATPEITTESALNIYPNPAESQLFVTADANVEEVSVYNVNGQQTIAISQQLSANSCTINVENLTSGVYFIKIRTENGESVKRFIKR